MSLREFWLKQLTLIVGFPFVVFCAATRVSLGPLLRHFGSSSSFDGQHAVSALLLACLVGAALAGATLLLFVLRAGALSSRMKKHVAMGMQAEA